MTMTSGRTRLLLVLLWVVGVLAGGQFAKLSVTFPYVRALFPEHGASLGFVVSAVSVVGVIFGLFAGVLIARFGFKRLLLAALLLGTAMSAFQATLPPFGWFLASRAVEGMSHLVVVVAAPTLIGQIAPLKLRNAAMTSWGTVFAVAFAMVSWLGAPVVEAGGLSALLLGHAVCMALMAVVLYRLVPPDVALETDRPFGLRSVWAQHVAAYRSPFIAAPAIGWIFYAGGFVAMVTVLPDFLPYEMRAFYTGVMPLSALTVSMIVGIPLLRFFSPVTVLLAGFVLAGSFAVVFALSGGAGLFAVAMLGAMGLIQAGTFSAVPALNATRETQALSNGAVAQAGNLGNLVGTPLLLLLVETLGFAGLIGFAVTLFVGGTVGHIWLATLRRNSLSSPEA